MGHLLPHWSEVGKLQLDKEEPPASFVPNVLYDLFGTVNHFGTLQSGHYVANVKVDEQWYHCNDAHVSLAGEGTGEADVLSSDGAYLLFYQQRV